MRSPVTPVIYALLFGLQLSCHAAVIWSDDFTGQTAGAGPSMNFPGGAAGNDYTFVAQTANARFVVDDTIGNSVPSLALVDTSTADQTILQVTMNHFAPFDVSPLSAAPILRVSFDLRFDSFSTTSNIQNVRFIFRANNVNNAGSQMVIGFSYADLNDGDASSTDLALFADTQTGNTTTLPPKNNTAIGLIPGAGWQPGFNFGDYDAGDATANDTNDEFYRVSFDYNSISGGISGTVTQLSSGTTVLLPAGLSLTPGTSFNNSVDDRFLIASTTTNTASAYFENLSFETVPEPTGALLLGSGLAILGMRRKRG